MSDRFQTILFEKKDRWAKITLNRPEVKNALSEIMTDELMSVFSEIEEDDLFWLNNINNDSNSPHKKTGDYSGVNMRTGATLTFKNFDKVYQKS